MDKRLKVVQYKLTSTPVFFLGIPKLKNIIENVGFNPYEPIVRKEKMLTYDKARLFLEGWIYAGNDLWLSPDPKDYHHYTKDELSDFAVNNLIYKEVYPSLFVKNIFWVNTRNVLNNNATPFLSRGERERIEKIRSTYDHGDLSKDNSHYFYYYKNNGFEFILKSQSMNSLLVVADMIF